MSEDFQASRGDMEGVIITLEGELMEGGSIDLKTLTQVLQGTQGMIREMTHITHFAPSISYRVTPPKEKCFEIILQAVQATPAVVPLLPQMAESVSTVISYTKSFLEMKRLSQGAPITRENLEAGPNNTTTVKLVQPIIGANNEIHNHFTINAPYNALAPAVESSAMNKNAQLVADAVAKDERVDQLKYGFAGGDMFTLPKAEAPYYAYAESTGTAQDELVGRVREINNKNYDGQFELTDDTVVKFKLDIEDIARMDDVVRDLCLAEAGKHTVALKGEKVFYKSGKKAGAIKLMKVRDIRQVDAPLGV